MSCASLWIGAPLPPDSSVFRQPTPATRELDADAPAEAAPAASAQGEIEDNADGADVAEEEPQSEADSNDEDDDHPAGAPASAPNTAASSSKPKIIFDDVRSCNITHSRRPRQQVNYKEVGINKRTSPADPASSTVGSVAGPRTRSSSSRPTPVLQSHRQGHAFVVQSSAANEDLALDSDSNDEIEDPEPVFTPTTWRQAMSCANAAHWKRAAEEEIRGMHMSGSYELVPRPMGPHTNVIDSKWVWKKLEFIETVVSYKRVELQSARRWMQATAQQRLTLRLEPFCCLCLLFETESAKTVLDLRCTCQSAQLYSCGSGPTDKAEWTDTNT